MGGELHQLQLGALNTQIGQTVASINTRINLLKAQDFTALNFQNKLLVRKSEISKAYDFFKLMAPDEQKNKEEIALRRKMTGFLADLRWIEGAPDQIFFERLKRVLAPTLLQRLANTFGTKST